MREVEFLEGGLRLRGTPLWFDARRKTDLAFVSHAHADHIGRHRRMIATEATLELLRLRLGARAAFDALPVPYRRPFTVGDVTLELFAAGHVLGSAQVRVLTRGGVRVGEREMDRREKADRSHDDHCGEQDLRSKRKVRESVL